ncbi:MAG: hydroxymethylbilane synthase [Deltaproteobacteria bacterium]|jgi:hydroxymethylbilane synthase|nr:hydroxymethylbilane synthase [Deltaproteobacteria bacterium]
MKLVLAARQSDLARLQAYETGRALEEAGRKQSKNIKIEYRFRSSLGDQRGDDPLWKMPEKGVFTEDFLNDLESGNVDLVVHSWKDLPVAERPSTLIAATLDRADVRDVILVRKDHWEARKLGSESGPFRILTSSPRRTYCLEQVLEWALPWSQCKAGRPQMEFVPVRGNIATRVGKIGQAHALVVAKAALDRLLESARYQDIDPAFAHSAEELRNAVKNLNFVVLPLSMIPTAAAQGALAIEVRKDHHELLELCRLIDSSRDRECVEEERNILASYGGGCHQKIGVTILKRDYGKVKFLRGLTDAGIRLETASIQSSRSQRFSPAVVWAGEGIHIERKSLPLQEIQKNLQHFLDEAGSVVGYFVARNEALPADLFTEGKCVWTAGLTTWKKLTARGVWVHGSSEGLGEDEFPKIETLLGRKMKWTRLTHQDAIGADLHSVSTYKATYTLTQPELLEGAKVYFWKSTGHFKTVFEAAPQLFKPHFALHAVGPGRTLGFVKAHLRSNGWTDENLTEGLLVVLNERELTREFV